MDLHSNCFSYSILIYITSVKYKNRYFSEKETKSNILNISSVNFDKSILKHENSRSIIKHHYFKSMTGCSGSKANLQNTISSSLIILIQRVEPIAFTSTAGHYYPYLLRNLSITPFPLCTLCNINGLLQFYTYTYHFIDHKNNSEN